MHYRLRLYAHDCKRNTSGAQEEIEFCLPYSDICSEREAADAMLHNGIDTLLSRLEGKLTDPGCECNKDPNAVEFPNAIERIGGRVYPTKFNLRVAKERGTG